MAEMSVKNDAMAVTNRFAFLYAIVRDSTQSCDGWVFMKQVILTWRFDLLLNFCKCKYAIFTSLLLES